VVPYGKIKGRGKREKGERREGKGWSVYSNIVKYNIVSII
jgi:hypothetical protein